uniref:X-prolyl aminopeptidase (aminopeptidase P) 2, membrane-bound n=1 Tax=Salarias fasciatus TaxID=181472 RepID=A0A672JE21_SALFA
AQVGLQVSCVCFSVSQYLPSTAVNTTLQLKELRERMRPLNISAYIIPGTDAHLSEYIAPRDARLAFMTGFTGSSGTAVVTQTKAALWTDSRYWVQAERQMDCNWELQTDSKADRLLEVPPGGQIGFDPFLFSLETHGDYSLILESSNRTLRSIPVNLVDQVWKDRPSIAADTPHDWSGRHSQLVCESLLTDRPVRFCFPPSGLFNLRGNDIPYNPFFYSYTLLTLDEIWLFVHMDRLTEELKVYLNASCTGPLCVRLRGYDSVLEHVKQYVSRPGVKVWIGTEYTNYALYELITPQDKLMTSTYSPVLTTKAVKDETEQRILRDAHVRDAVAVIQLLMWLEKSVPSGAETELSAADYVNKRRSEQKDSRGPSFETISASGPNAALAHYSPTNETNRRLTVDEMYLVDSGGQYLDGTTDITRTVHWGKPTAMQKEAYTRVLMGNIEISRTIFPSGKRGVNMEMLGRRALWEVGLDYGHGTGHGVGNYFGVHECMSCFSSRRGPEGAAQCFKPGYYKENDFGIRIEDVVVTYGNNYLTFDTVSLVPYDRKLIDTSLLSSEQIQWLNQYYGKIRRLLGPELDSQGLREEREWMLKHTEPFAQSGSSAAASSSSLTFLLLILSLFHNVV